MPSQIPTKRISACSNKFHDSVPSSQVPKDQRIKIYTPLKQTKGESEESEDLTDKLLKFVKIGQTQKCHLPCNIGIIPLFGNKQGTPYT